MKYVLKMALIYFIFMVLSVFVVKCLFFLILNVFFV